MDYDQTAMPAVYDAGRGYSPTVLASWLRTISSAIPPMDIRDILDLGCGTGRYSAALAAHFEAAVVAVDPSKKMIAEARRKPADGVRFMHGRGEVIPLPDNSVDMVFISMVIHHFENPVQAIRECHRVLRPDGVVCLRTGVTERVDEYAYVPFFPETRPLFGKLQNMAEIDGIFSDANFERVHHEVVSREVAENWAAYATKIAFRAHSILVQLGEDEFQRGLGQLREFAASASPVERVIEPVDFFVFRRL